MRGSILVAFFSFLFLLPLPVSTSFRSPQSTCFYFTNRLFLAHACIVKPLLHEPSFSLSLLFLTLHPNEDTLSFYWCISNFSISSCWSVFLKNSPLDVVDVSQASASLLSRVELQRSDVILRTKESKGWRWVQILAAFFSCILLLSYSTTSFFSLLNDPLTSQSTFPPLLTVLLASSSDFSITTVLLPLLIVSLGFDSKQTLRPLYRCFWFFFARVFQCRFSWTRRLFWLILATRLFSYARPSCCIFRGSNHFTLLVASFSSAPRTDFFLLLVHTFTSPSRNASCSLAKNGRAFSSLSAHFCHTFLFLRLWHEETTISFCGIITSRVPRAWW